MLNKQKRTNLPMPVFYEYGELQQQQQQSIPKKLWLVVTVLRIIKTADDEKLPFLGGGATFAAHFYKANTTKH
jgi:hypothetical protein